MGHRHSLLPVPIGVHVEVESLWREWSLSFRVTPLPCTEFCICKSVCFFLKRTPHIVYALGPITLEPVPGVTDLAIEVRAESSFQNSLLRREPLCVFHYFFPRAHRPIHPFTSDASQSEAASSLNLSHQVSEASMVIAPYRQGRWDPKKQGDWSKPMVGWFLSKQPSPQASIYCFSLPCQESLIAWIIPHERTCPGSPWHHLLSITSSLPQPKEGPFPQAALSEHLSQLTWSLLVVLGNLSLNYTLSLLSFLWIFTISLRDNEATSWR